MTVDADLNCSPALDNSSQPPFLFRTSGFSQSSWLNLELTEAALSIPFFYDVQSTTICTLYMVACTLYKKGMLTATSVKKD